MFTCVYIDVSAFVHLSVCVSHAVCLVKCGVYIPYYHVLYIIRKKEKILKAYYSSIFVLDEQMLPFQ